MRNGTGNLILVRKYICDGQEVIAELDEDDNTLVRYTHSGMRTDDVLSMDVTSYGVSKGIAQAAGSYFFHKDGLGSIIEITNSSGNIIQHYVYSSFGKILKVMNGSVDNTQNPLIKTNFAYTNREYDSESGLYYYRARYYDAHIGRFLQEDPHPGVISKVSTFNSKYNYVGNDPLNNVDPTGEFVFAAIFVYSIVATSMTTTMSAAAIGAILAFTSTLAAYEMQNGFDTKAMLANQGGEALLAATIAAVGGAVGAWAGKFLGEGFATGLRLKGWVASAFEGGMIGALSSAGATASLGSTGMSKGKLADDTFNSFMWGAFAGSIVGGSNFYFNTKVSIPVAVGTEGGVFIYTGVPIDDTKK